MHSLTEYPSQSRPRTRLGPRDSKDVNEILRSTGRDRRWVRHSLRPRPGQSGHEDLAIPQDEPSRPHRFEQRCGAEAAFEGRSESRLCPKGTPNIESATLDDFLGSHLIDPGLLRKDDFNAFLNDRQRRLLVLIERATGKAAYAGNSVEEGTDVEDEEDGTESAETSLG